MVSPRLSQILAADTVGRAVVYRPSGGSDLSALDGADVQIVQGFKPDYDVWATRYDTRIAAQGDFDIAVIAVPRSKAHARALIADAAARATRVIVDGQKTDGIDSLLKDVKKRADVGQVVSKAHGKAFSFHGGDFADWADPGPTRNADGFMTALGVFSADKVDVASRLLAETLPKAISGRVVDLGAGWGYLAAEILKRSGVTTLDLVEAEHAALECAKLNVTDPRAAFHWADAREFKSAALADVVVTNPPFHTSRAAEPALGQAFIAQAAAILRPGGKLWLVANRQLPYEATVAQYFGSSTEVVGANGFKVLTATKPLRKPARKG